MKAVLFALYKYLSSLLHRTSLIVFTISTAIKHIAHFVKHGTEDHCA